VIALGLDVLLDLIFVPLFHVNGAAAMSSVAYGCALIATLYWYRRVSGGSIREAMIWRPSDRRHYLRIIRRFRERGGVDKSVDLPLQ
jgi:Na+-driven multidrug efflux pump